jgi:hypothetical protein
VPSRRVLWAIGVPAVALFLLISFWLARWLSVESQERAAIADLLRAEARGDARGAAGQLTLCTDVACRAKVARIVAQVRGPGDVRIARLDSATAHTFGTRRGWTRVVWVRGATGRPVVQCVDVRRKGSPLTGRSVSLLRLTAPLANNEDSC